MTPEIARVQEPVSAGSGPVLALSIGSADRRAVASSDRGAKATIAPYEGLLTQQMIAGRRLRRSDFLDRLGEGGDS